MDIHGRSLLSTLDVYLSPLQLCVPWVTAKSRKDMYDLFN